MIAVLWQLDLMYQINDQLTQTHKCLILDSWQSVQLPVAKQYLLLHRLATTYKAFYGGHMCTETLVLMNAIEWVNFWFQ